MSRPRCWILALTLCGAAAPARADDARRLADRIDELVAARWAEAGATPAPPADDATFLRRLSLDVVGKIPAVSDVRRFLADSAADKRERAVRQVLDSPGYARHFSSVWRDLLLPEANADFQQRYYCTQLENWLRKEFADNVSHDRLARDLLTVPLPAGRDGMLEFQLRFRRDTASPMAFYLSKGGKPENLAASTARLFLGVRLECAQCHNHPFGRWTREQFWSQAAFFAGIRGDGLLGEVPDRRELSIPNSERVAQARFLDGTEPRWRYKVSARATLAEWMTAPDNPFFARAGANRLWAHFFGVGIVDPPDDFNDENRPSHPELLDELARQFAGHGYDYKFLIRAITLSKTYQLSSVHPGPEVPDLRLFARMPVKGLSPDQLFDSFVRATGTPVANPGQRRFAPNTPQGQFLARFAGQERVTEHQTSIPQALALMNSRLVGDATHVGRGEVLSAVASAPFMDTAGRVETLYLATLSRKPRPEERERFVRYVEEGGATKDPKAALADVFWALLNSTEFVFNH
jgi:hypothetical protein